MLLFPEYCENFCEISLTALLRGRQRRAAGGARRRRGGELGAGGGDQLGRGLRQQVSGAISGCNNQHSPVQQQSRRLHQGLHVPSLDQ